MALALTGRYTYRQIGGMLGMNPGSVHRRARALERRLSDPLVGALLEFPVGLDAKFREVGLDRHLLGKPVRTIAREREMTEREVKAVIGFLADWVRLAREKLRAARE
jgi:DNA-directed RNA polymerase specialized sigma24 family protein